VEVTDSSSVSPIFRHFLSHQKTSTALSGPFFVGVWPFPRSVVGWKGPAAALPMQPPLVFRSRVSPRWFVWQSWRQRSFGPRSSHPLSNIGKGADETDRPKSAVLAVCVGTRLIQTSDRLDLITAPVAYKGWKKQAEFHLAPTVDKCYPRPWTCLILSRGIRTPNPPRPSDKNLVRQ